MESALSGMLFNWC